MAVSVAVPQRGRRHPVTAVMLARSLAAGGWSKADIARLIREDGYDVSERTIALWVDPEVNERRRHRQQIANGRRAERKGHAPLGRCDATPEFKLGRLRALEGIGLAVPAIAKVMRHDFGDPITPHQVREALKTGKYPSRAPRGSSSDRRAT